jgi:hypothetical protein
VIDGVDSISFSGLDDRLLLLNNGGELLVEDGKLGKSLLNALKFTVTSTNITEYGACMTGTICS